MDNVVVKDAKFGKGLFAARDIKKDEVVADFSGGKTYKAEKISDLPEEVADHAVQFGEHEWIDTETNGRFINHSCEPNCGIKGKFKVVALRDIKKGEEIKTDYEMHEDADWRMNCECGTKSCRKVIGAYKNMPESIRKKYKGYISDWLINKYK